MSEKKKTTTGTNPSPTKSTQVSKPSSSTKAPIPKKTDTKTAIKEPKTSPVKSSSTQAKKPIAKTTEKKPAQSSKSQVKTTVPKKQPATIKRSVPPPSSKKLVATPVKKPSTATAKKSESRKTHTIKAQILSYRRDKRLQKTNQAIAKILDKCNHKALIGKEFVLTFPDSETITKGKVISIHGQKKSNQVRIRFNNAGMTAHAITRVIEIQA